MELQKIREIPLSEFLSRLGHEPATRKGNALWYSAPYREERTPSFQVNVYKNVWYDFGLGRGGDIFHLAGELTGSDDFKAQAKFIWEVWRGTLPEIVTAVRPKGRKDAGNQPGEESRFVKIEVGPLYNKVLLRYLEQRGIISDMALPNCEEVRYRLYGKPYFAVGFRNVSSGYELRNRFFKGSLSPKDVSGIFNGSDICNLFEGFMDYLSWMMLGLGCGEDHLVLNSVALLERSYEFLDRYARIKCYLDNDAAGKRTLEALRMRYGDKVQDCSGLYKEYKDLNEYLQKESLQEKYNQ